ncbi:DUF6192 family protein [Streptomyces sp. NPDC007172]
MHLATQVATDLLRWPSVAFKAMRDDTARHQVRSCAISGDVRSSATGGL